MAHLFSYLLAVIVSVAIVSPWIIFFLVGFLFLCYRLRSFYLRGSRQIKRLEAVSRSPVFSLFGECMNGLPSIRSTTSRCSLRRICRPHFS
jgi:ATP-binding cassette subfamily C (CFTR/MRP) protein 4